MATYIKRKNAGKMPRQALEYQLEGKRPTYGLREQVKKTVKKREIKWVEMVEEETCCCCWVL